MRIMLDEKDMLIQLRNVLKMELTNKQVMLQKQTSNEENLTQEMEQKNNKLVYQKQKIQQLLRQNKELQQELNAKNKVDQVNMKCSGINNALRQFYMTRLIVVGIGIWLLPVNQSCFVLSLLLGTTNCFNLIYSYKHGRITDLMKQSVVSAVYLMLSKYLSCPKKIGFAIAIHGLSDMFNLYRCIGCKHDNERNDIRKEVSIYAALNVCMGIATLCIWKEKYSKQIYQFIC
eukprot:275835_1